MKLFVSKRSLLLVAIFALVFTSCGTEEPQEELVPDRECGPGTELQDRQCVLAPFQCSEGQVVLPTGGCGAPSLFCGTGSAYDASANACIPFSEVSCGPGTVEVNNRCVIEDNRSCGNGTVLADGHCRLRDSVCGTGTSLEGLQCLPDEGACRGRTIFDVITGQCTDPAMVECGEGTFDSQNQCRALASFADELAAEADFDFTSSNRTITPGSTLGNQVVFTGTMTSGSLFQTFPVTAEANTWLKITLYPRGVPSLGFRMVQTTGTGFDRRVLPGRAAVPSRTVRVPVSGNYNLVIETLLSTATGGPFGNSSWSYVGVVEVVEAPESRTWNLLDEGISGDIRNDDAKLIDISVPANTQSILSVNQLGTDVVNGVVELWTPGGTFESRHSISAGSTVTVEAGNAIRNVQVLFDAREWDGPRAHFSATALQTTSILPGAVATRTVEAQAGELIYIAHANTGFNPLAVRVSREGTPIFSSSAVLASNRTSYTSTQSRRAAVYAPESGVYTIEFENTGTAQISGFFTTITTVEPPTIDLGDDTLEFEYAVTQSMPTGDWRFVVIKTSSVARFTGQIQANATGDPEATIFTLGGTSIRTFTAGGTTEPLNFTLDNPGTYIFAIRPFSTLTQGFTMEVEVEPLESFNPGESIVENLNGSTFDILTGRLDYLSGGAPDLRILNPDGQAIFERLAAPSGTQVLELLPGSGNYTVEIVHNGTTPTLQLESDFSVHTPVQNLDRISPFSEQYTTSEAMEEGAREFHLLRARNTFNHIFEITILDDEDEPESVQLRIYDLVSGALLRDLTESGPFETALNLQSGLYLVEVIAVSDLESGYSLEWTAEESNIFTVSIGSTPNLAIPDNTPAGVNDTITIPNCPIIIDIDMDINITHTWRGDLIVQLTSPGGETKALKSRFGGSTDNIIGNFNETLGASRGFSGPTVAPISDFSGESGTGTWTLNISDNVGGDIGTLNSWQLNLTCDG